MTNQDLTSATQIERVGYDPGTRALTVWFRGSRRYDFSDVPAEVYEQLRGSEASEHPRCDRTGGPAFPKLGAHPH